MERSYIHPRKKYRIKKVNNFICDICKNVKSSEELEIDHIKPISEGGTNETINLRPICIECHLQKTKDETETYNQSKIYEHLLSPQEKLKNLVQFLEDNTQYTYSDIQFLILNHPLLSKFEYNTTTLSNLYNQIHKKTKKTEKNSRYFIERNKILYLLKKDSKKTYVELEKMLNNIGINMSYVQISRICAKFGDKEREKDKRDIKELVSNEKDLKEPLSDKELPKSNDFDDKLTKIE